MNQFNPDSGYTDGAYPESRPLEAGLETTPLKAVLRAVLKRPWVVALTFFILIVPALFYLFSQVPLYQSRATITMASKSSVNPFSIQGGSRLFEEEDPKEFFFSLLESFAFRKGVFTAVSERHPYMPVDSLEEIIRSDIKFSARTRLSDIIILSAQSESPEFAQLLASSSVKTLEQIINDMKKNDAKFLVDYINRLVENYNRELGDTEVRIRDFLRDRNLSLDDVAEGVNSELSSLERNLAESEAKRDLARLQIDSYSLQITERLNKYLAGSQGETSREIANLRQQLEDVNRRITGEMLRDSQTNEIQSLEAERKAVLAKLIEYGNSQRDLEEGGVSSRISLQALEGEVQKKMIEFKEAQTSSEYFNGAIDKYLIEHPHLPNDILEYLNMSRSKSVQERTIDILVEKRETARIDMLSEVGGVRLLDEPVVPNNPIPLKRNLKIFGIILLALFAGVMLAYAIDYFDNTVQSESDISQRFGLPVYGSVPVLSPRAFRRGGYGKGGYGGYGYGSYYGGYGHSSGGSYYGSYYSTDEDSDEDGDKNESENNGNGGTKSADSSSQPSSRPSRSHHSHHRHHSHRSLESTSTAESSSSNGSGVELTLLEKHSPTSPIAEAYRSIKTSILFNAKERNQKSFVISSSVATEGKSLTTHNLAISCAQSGLKTLIIDADLRRSSQHKLLKCERKPGLTGILLGEHTVEQVLREGSVPNLYLIPAGGKVNNPSDLLSSNTMREFLKDIEQQYDIVFLDTPPISPVMDSRYLAGMTGGMVLLVRQEMTKLPVLEHCIDLCHRVDVNIQGVIMNHTSFRYGYGYYYVYQRYNPYGYYYRGYQYYYSTDETGKRIKKKRHRTSRRDTETAPAETSPPDTHQEA